MFFRTRLNRIHRFFVEGVIVGVLGRNTNCEIESLENREGSSIVRLTSPCREDLERVAEALSQRIWEQEQTSQLQELQPIARNIDQLMPLAALQGLSELIDQLVEIKLKNLEIDRAYQPIPRIVINNVSGDFVNRDKNESNVSGQVGAQSIGERAQTTLQGNADLVQGGKQTPREDDQKGGDHA